MFEGGYFSGATPSGFRCYRILFKSVVTPRLKGVGNLPRKTDLKLYFELSLNGLSVVRYFYRLL